MTECICQNLQNHILREMEFTVGDLYLNIWKGVKKGKMWRSEIIWRSLARFASSGSPDFLSRKYIDENMLIYLAKFTEHQLWAK